ncbi:15118_t:CDS:2, partial [Racocetra persica]
KKRFTKPFFTILGKHSRNSSITTKNNPKHSAQGLVNNEIGVNKIKRIQNFIAVTLSESVYSLHNNSQDTGHESGSIRSSSKKTRLDSLLNRL